MELLLTFSNSGHYWDFYSLTQEKRLQKPSTLSYFSVWQCNTQRQLYTAVSNNVTIMPGKEFHTDDTAT